MSILLPAFMASGGVSEIVVRVSSSRALDVPPPERLSVNGSSGTGVSGYLQLAEVGMEDRVIVLGTEIRVVLVGAESRTVSVASEHRTVQA